MNPSRTPVVLQVSTPGSPMFSIITVTLNSGDLLLRTIESVKSQKYSNFEHIIKDGMSKDGSLEQQIQSDESYQPIVIVSADTGIYDAMNQGLAHASGKFVLFLNAGDILFDQRVLGALAQEIERTPSIGVLYGDYYLANFAPLIKSPSPLTRFSLFRNTLCHQACIESRELIMAAGGFDSSLRILADYDLLLNIIFFRKATISYLPYPLAICLGGGFSTRVENVLSGQLEAIQVRNRYFTQMERMIKGCLLAITLPGFRIWIMRQGGHGPIQRIYTFIANFWNN